MTIERFTWIVGRTLYYIVLFLLLIVVIYTLAHDYFLAGLISLVVFVLVLYLSLIHI